MFQTNAAHLLCEREQKIVPVIGVAAEQRFGFLDQFYMRSELGLFRLQEFCVIRDDVEMDPAGQLMGLEILSGENRAVYQSIIVGFFIGNPATGP